MVGLVLAIIIKRIHRFIFGPINYAPGTMGSNLCRVQRMGSRLRELSWAHRISRRLLVTTHSVVYTRLVTNLSSMRHL